jgi:hypothetical protein
MTGFWKAHGSSSHYVVLCYAFWFLPSPANHEEEHSSRKSTSQSPVAQDNQHPEGSASATPSLGGRRRTPQRMGAAVYTPRPGTWDAVLQAHQTAGPVSGEPTREAGSWICLSPDLELERADLTVQAHVVLDRASPTPAPQAFTVRARTFAAGQATTTAFNENIMTKLNDHANASEQTRLWKEEQGASCTGSGHFGSGGGALQQASDGNGGVPNDNVKGSPERGAPGGGGGGAGAAGP